MHIKASIRTRCYADLNLRRSSRRAVYHRVLSFSVSRCCVWRFQRFQRVTSWKPGFLPQILVYLLALISRGGNLCVYALHTFIKSYLISLHTYQESLQQTSGCSIHQVNKKVHFNFNPCSTGTQHKFR